MKESYCSGNFYNGIFRNQLAPLSRKDSCDYHQDLLQFLIINNLKGDNSMFQGQYTTTHRSKAHDEDIENLRALIAQLIRQGSKKQSQASQSFDLQKYLKIQQENKQLKQRVQSLTSENKKIILELLTEREENSRLKNQVASNQTTNSLSFDKIQRSSTQAHIDKMEPNRHLYESQLIRPQQSSPSKLITFNESSSINRDQLYRLNSNLIEYNTNIKLLIQKYNYLHKLRGLNFSNDTQQFKVINQANQIFSNRKSIEQAQSILQSSRKKYFGSDSSSDIEQQMNQIQENS